jgi:8-oxo-dGTP diphosphatase
MGEIAAVGAVVLDLHGRILLVLRANEPARGTWSLPGGRVEVGESAQEAVIREVFEETGLTVSLVREVGSVIREAPAGGTYVIRDFLAQVLDPRTPVAGDDASDAAWFAPHEILGLSTSPGLVEALRAWDLFPQAP